MQIAQLIETAKIAVHWDHILAPSDSNAGKVTDDSWKGTAKKVAGLVVFALSCFLIGPKSSFLLFAISGSYHSYHAYQKAQIKPEGPPPQELSDEEIDRRNQIGIDAIIKANEAGKKIGLVIGRCKNQPVPQEEGWLWVAGNIEGDPEILEGRIDLKMDFNQDETYSKLQGLFDKVVIDVSTIKFIRAQWERGKHLLKPLETSQLITEALSGCMGISPGVSGVDVDCRNAGISYSMDYLQKETEEGKQLFADWKSRVSDKELEAEKKACLEKHQGWIENEQDEKFENQFRYEILNKYFPDRYLAGREAGLEGMERCRHYLKSLFNLVELYHGCPFPTREGIRYPEKEDFFVLTGPTEPSKERVRVFENRRCR